MMCCTTVDKGNRQAGFTLVEMLVSVTILAIGILALGQIFAFSNQNASFGRTETLAVSLAREIQEKILSESIEHVQMVFDGVDTQNAGSVTTPCEEWAQHLTDQLGDHARGTITVMDSDEDPSLLAHMFSVHIEIQWKKGDDPMVYPLDFAITNLGT